VAKKILFESTIHQLASAAKRLSQKLEQNRPQAAEGVRNFSRSWEFSHLGGMKCSLKWFSPSPGEATLDVRNATFYRRGDDQRFASEQKEAHQTFALDQVQSENQEFFDGLLAQLLAQAGVLKAHAIDVGVLPTLNDMPVLERGE
jgi:hypothetical protein